MRATIIFDNFGPYHLARLQAAAGICELLAIEIAARSAEYAWAREAQTEGQWLEDGSRRAEGRASSFELRAPLSAFKHVTLLETGTSRSVATGELQVRLNQALKDSRSQVVFIPGWSGRAAFAALAWCASHNVPTVAMSESTAWDETRSAWREVVKRQFVGLCASAFVGGAPHKDYMVELGMPPEHVFPGYDAVDNGYFGGNVEKLKGGSREKFELPDKYFLASARFIEKKNLPRLIEAYARYRKKAESRKQKAESEKANAEMLKPETLKSAIWDLVLLGDGALRSSLASQVSSLDLQDCVHLPGFKQYPDLPAYYANAGAFIHASTTEQWGLVVNEAMASGLPVLVSNRCGCASDLVREGVNGFTFDPYDVEQLAGLMLKIAAFNFPLSAFGSESQHIIAGWGPERFASGLKAAAECALKIGSVKPSQLQRMILKLLLTR